MISYLFHGTKIAPSNSAKPRFVFKVLVVCISDKPLFFINSVIPLNALFAKIGLGDLAAELIIWPSTQVEEDAALTVFANVQVI